jgi:hypothetical protein
MPDSPAFARLREAVQAQAFVHTVSKPYELYDSILTDPTITSSYLHA